MRGSAAFRAAVAPGGVLAGPWVRNELWRRARAVPSLDLRFAENKSLVDATTGANLVTFTRASSGTYVGSDGLIKTATTNLLLQSEDFSTTWNVANYILTSGFQSPSGTLTATKIARDSALVTGAVIGQNVNVASSTAYTYSCYLKAGELSKAAIREGASTGASISVDLSTGTLLDENQIGSDYAITPVGNGWYRVSFYLTSTSSQTSFGCRIYALPDSYTTGSPIFNWAGDDTSGIYIWGAQLEQSSTVGEYIPTTSTINSAPRFDHNPTTGESLGLLVEESRANLLLRSEDFATTWSGAGTIDANTVVAPDGTLTADTITTATNAVKTQASQSFAAGSTLTVSVFAKKNVTNFLRFEIGGVANCWYNLETGAVGTSTAGSGNVLFSAKSIQPYPNGWYRCILTLTTSTITTVSVLIYATTNDGQGLSGGESIHLWGAQLEVGSFPTSYIPTEGTTVTRAADVASISGSNFNTSQFSRASTATFYNSSGIITTANVDIPRNNYNPTTLVAEGLLLEPQRQNLLLHSEDVDQHALSAVTSSLDATTAPDNATTADEIAPTAVNSEHYVGYTANVTAGKTYTFSAYVKPNGATAVRLRFALAGFNNEAGWHVFATNTTTPGGVGLRVIAIQNGWYRIEGTAVAAATAVGSPRIYPNTVNGWLGVPAEAMYVWGAQLEEGADATSYIPTTTTEVTRSADVPAVSPWYRQDAGSVFSDSSIIASQVQTQAVYGFTGGSFLTSLRQPQFTADQFRAQINGTFSPSPGTGAGLTTGTTKAAIAYLNTTGRLQVGSAGSDVSAAGTSDANELAIGGLGGASTPLNGRVKRLTYWPQRLSNSTLANITQ